MLIFILYCCEAATGFVATSWSTVGEDNLNSGNYTVYCVNHVDTFLNPLIDVL